MSSRVSQSPMSPAPTRTATGADDPVVVGDSVDGDADEAVPVGVALALALGEGDPVELAVGLGVGPPLARVRTEASPMSKTMVATRTSAPMASCVEPADRRGPGGPAAGSGDVGGGIPDMRASLADSRRDPDDPNVQVEGTSKVGADTLRRWTMPGS